MENYFEVSVRYDKLTEDGMCKKVKECYIMNALTFAEAEKTAQEYVAQCWCGEFDVTAIKIVKLADVVATTDNGADRYYLIKHKVVTHDEKTGKEKEHTEKIIFQASDINDARNRHKEYNADWLLDGEPMSIVETKYIEYINVNNNEGRQNI